MKTYKETQKSGSQKVTVLLNSSGEFTYTKPIGKAHRKTELIFDDFGDQLTILNGRQVKMLKKILAA